MRGRLLLLAALAACTVEHQVLDDPAGVVVTCDEAWLGQLLAPCAFEGTCDRASPLDPECCTDFAYCSMDDGLVVDTICAPNCGCEGDFECTYGAAYCEGARCVECPPIDFCSDCDPSWTRLTRNGCETCTCAPPSECTFPGVECDDNGAELCYVGAVCANGCDPYLDAGCCANVCSTPGCAEPAPIGCWTDCPVELGCSICATGWCECDGERWICEPVCLEGSFEAVCTYP
jgi:hypothetical protein